MNCVLSGPCSPHRRDRHAYRFWQETRRNITACRSTLKCNIKMDLKGNGEVLWAVFTLYRTDLTPVRCEHAVNIRLQYKTENFLSIKVKVFRKLRLPNFKISVT